MLIIVRHGRTASNAAGVFLGRADPPLDATGETQADAVAALLEGAGRVITSPLVRARQTAKRIADRSGVGVEVDDRFIELDYGQWDERPLVDVSAAEWEEWHNDLTFAPPGGESLEALGRRVRVGLDELVTDAGQRDVVVVTHVSPLKAAIAWSLGVGDEIVWRMFVSPAAICRIDVSRGRPSLHSFGESA